MKNGFYLRLAANAIKKNKQFYLPYILTSIGMIMMFYIITSLVYCPLIQHVRGSEAVFASLSMGRGIIALFILIFLFYTNSFLLRRRKKEFGLYHMLGMNKRSIGRILFREVLMVLWISLIFGMGLGIAFSKFVELGLLRAMHGEIDYAFRIAPRAVIETAGLSIIVFTAVFVRGILSIRHANALALLRSENVGEKPPKANWLMALAGLALLGGAYGIAVTIESPLTALALFFIAALMVVLGTYLLLITGSVTLCRMLQKKKSYYYKANHFVSVSSMAYRMKRNGAGLASICILSTMVLVMISSTASLFIGAEDNIRNRYPRNMVVEVTGNGTSMLDKTNQDVFRAVVDEAAGEDNIKTSSLLEFSYATISGLLQNGELETDVKAAQSAPINYDSVCYIMFIPLSDYNRINGTKESLEPDEAFVFTSRMKYKEPTLQIGDARPLKIKQAKEAQSASWMDGVTMELVVPSLYVVVPDLEEYVQPLLPLADYRGDPMLLVKWYYGFDSTVGEEEQKQITENIQAALSWLTKEGGSALPGGSGSYSYTCESAAENRQSFYAMYGGLFFLGLILSIVFIFAAVLIIYYKQISEGFEDQQRFEIMQKCGMSKKLIRKSINSQILTVFFLPLLLAGLHLAFAFPFVWKILQMLALKNLPLLIGSTVASFLLFGLFYGVIYRLTSNVYFRIVSGNY